jgi:hypothetical protein
MWMSGTIVHWMPSLARMGIMRSLKHISAGKKPAEGADPHVTGMRAFCAWIMRRSTASSTSGLMGWWKETTTGSSRGRPPEVVQPMASRYGWYQLEA